MRKILLRYLPHRDTVKNNRWLRPFDRWLNQPAIWHLHRRSVATGVAIGLFCGLIPGPLQMLSAAMMVIVFRANLPVALFATLYTNPFTIVPLYMLAYRLGVLLSGMQNGPVIEPFPGVHWQNGGSALWGWLAQMGKPLLIGLPLLAVLLSLASYVVVQVVWRFAVLWKWRHRRNRKNGVS